jgi:hypothetical protein
MFPFLAIFRGAPSRKVESSWAALFVRYTDIRSLLLTTMNKLLWPLLGLVALGAAVLFLSVDSASRFRRGVPKSADQICGTYVHDTPIAHQELVLREDGTCTHMATIKATSEEVSYAGTWKYHTRVRRGIRRGDVVFENGFLQVLSTETGELDPNYAKPRKGGANLPVQYSYGGLGGQLVLWENEFGPQWRKVR